MTAERTKTRPSGPPLYVVSGGTGASGDLVARTVLAQFHEANVKILVRPHIQRPEQLDSVVAEAADAGGAIVHSMVNRACREYLIRTTDAAGVPNFDLVAPLMTYLGGALDQEPLGQPGLYRQLNRAYFDRVEAIEFAVAHDDGKRPEDLPHAEIVLIGLSRVGKTPLSMYLSILGWKTANVPFVPEIPLPAELTMVDQRRVVALTVDPAQLMSHRRWRQSRTGIPAGAYVDRTAVVQEMRAARHFYFRQGYPVVDATDKPIESCADEVLALIADRLGGVLEWPAGDAQSIVG